MAELVAVGVLATYSLMSSLISLAESLYMPFAGDSAFLSEW